MTIHGQHDMRLSTDSLARWLVGRERFDRWVNVLADNDNLPAGGARLQEETLPAVSLMSFY